MVTDADRADPLALLAQQDKCRLSDLVPLRYGRMSRTPFTFLRGAATVMASDLAAGSRTDLWVELCGDAHLGNFRWYHAPDRQLVFDLNDFDETLPGPFESEAALERIQRHGKKHRKWKENLLNKAARKNSLQHLH